MPLGFLKNSLKSIGVYLRSPTINSNKQYEISPFVLLKLFAKRIGIDKAIAYSVSARIIQAAGGLASIALISIFLTKEEQGFYYTFGSIIAIQILFELGLNGIITQYVAHELVHLQWVSSTKLTGNPINLSRLCSLLTFSIKVFSVLALVLFLVLQISGYYFFTKFSNNSNVDWQLAWQAVALATSLLTLMNPVLAFLEGLGKVKEVARMRLGQSTLNIFVITIVFVTKGGLMALGIAALVSFVYLLACILFSANWPLLVFIYKQKGEWHLPYWSEIFPYQYKIALSWVGSYFIFQLFNPVLFATEGSVVAGRMGMTLAALNGISTLSMSWISTKIPKFSGLIAQKKFVELDTIFNITTRQLMVINVFLIISLVSFVLVLRQYSMPLSDRFLYPLPLTLLAITIVVNQLIFSWSIYLRCHKKEPYLWNSVAMGILSALSTFILGNHFGLLGIVGGYTVLTIAVSLPWAYLIFKNKRLEWHGQHS